MGKWKKLDELKDDFWQVEPTEVENVDDLGAAISTLLGFNHDESAEKAKSIRQILQEHISGLKKSCKSEEILEPEEFFPSLTYYLHFARPRDLELERKIRAKCPTTYKMRADYRSEFLLDLTHTMPNGEYSLKPTFPQELTYITFYKICDVLSLSCALEKSTVWKTFRSFRNSISITPKGYVRLVDEDPSRKNKAYIPEKPELSH